MFRAINLKLWERPLFREPLLDVLPAPLEVVVGEAETLLSEAKARLCFVPNIRPTR